MAEYVRAFGLMSAARTYGMSPNPISLSDLVAYTQIYEVDDLEEFIHLIQTMDKVYLKKVSEKK